MKHAVCGGVLITVGALVAPAPARAAEADEAHTKSEKPFGARGTIAVLLEHLAGVSYHRYTIPSGGGDTAIGDAVQGEALKPDVAVDGFLLDHLSVGASAEYEGQTLMYAHSDYTETMHHAALVPRVGYAYSWPSRLGVWAQASVGGSITWATAFPQSGSPMVTRFGSVTAGLALLGTYSPAAHVVLSAGPWVVRELYRGEHDWQGMPDFKDTMPIGLSIGAGVYL